MTIQKLQCYALVACIILSTAFEAVAQKKKSKQQAGENLVLNGDFEQGGTTKQPKHWAKLDGLTGKLEQNAGNPGACLTLDTSVLQSDKKLNKQDEEAFKKKGRSQGHQYATVGAHEGAWAYATPIDLKPDDQWFILSADVQAPLQSAPMVFIRGFVKITGDQVGKDSSWFHDYYGDGIGYSEMFGPKELYRPSKEGDYLMVYRHTLTCRVGNVKEFRRFQLGFKLPTIKKFRPERILVKPYAYWPNGVYRFDNISLRRATKEEADEVNRNRPSIKETE
ncbi:MAG: hypothetical protein GX561_05195 [Lentisphaerae bacterium]|jgi:hypothetical protein|nr:hypothetical protein [Lentisphaerota bacterium]